MADAPELLALTKQVDPGALEQAAADATSLRTAALDLERLAADLRRAGQDTGMEGTSADAGWPRFDALRREIVASADGLVTIAQAAVSARSTLEAAQAAYDQLPPGDIPAWQKAALIGGGAVLGPAGPIAGSVLADQLGDAQAEKRRAEAQIAYERLTSGMQRHAEAMPELDRSGGGRPVSSTPVGGGSGGSTSGHGGGSSSGGTGGGAGGAGGTVGWSPAATASVAGFDPVRGTGSSPQYAGGVAVPGGVASSWPGSGGSSQTLGTAPLPGADGTPVGGPGWSPGSADGAVSGTTGGVGAVGGPGGPATGGAGTTGTGGAGGVGGALAGGLAVGGAALGSAGLRGAGRNGAGGSPVGSGAGAAEAGRTGGLTAGTTSGGVTAPGGARVPLGGTAGPSGLGMIHPAPATGSGAAAGGRGSAVSGLRGSALTQGTVAATTDAARGTSSAGGSAMVPPAGGGRGAEGSRRRRSSDGLLLPEIELDESERTPRSRAERAGRRGTAAAVVGAPDEPADDDSW